MKNSGRSMRTFLSPLLLCLAVAASPALAAPQDAIWVCTDADGHKSFQNSSDGAHCRRMDGLVASIPAAPSPAQGRDRATTARVSSASFPRIDAGTQRAREAERRGILEQELRSEQSRLAQLRSQVATPGEGSRRIAEDIERSEGNIAALQRELAPQRF